MSTMPVSKRSTHVRLPLAGSVSHLALPRLVSTIPSTGDRGQFLREDRVGHRHHRQVAGVPGGAVGGGHLGGGAPAVEHRRGHVRLGADGEPGSRRDLLDRLGDCLRTQEVLRHSHFCLQHSRFGK